MKYRFVCLIPLMFLAGCGGLPDGEPPQNPAGRSSVPQGCTREMAESSFAASLTQFAVRKGIAPVRYYPMPDVPQSLLRLLDPELFQRAEANSYEYLLISVSRGSDWTLSLKRKSSADFLWTRTIQIQ